MGILKGIDPLLTADVLHVLRSMGHGNKLVVCDCNFPAGARLRPSPCILHFSFSRSGRYSQLSHVLSAVGRGSAEIATHTTTGKHIVLTVPLPEALGAICSVLPLDYFVEAQAMYMAPQEGVDLPPAGVEVVSALKDEIARRCGSDTRVDPIERFAFYEEARGCFAVIQTMERRPYGNVVLVKGCVGFDGNDLRPVTPYHCPMRTPGQSKTD